MALAASVLIDGSGHLEFSYSIPAHLEDKAVVGARVRVPLRTRQAMGTIIGLGESDLPRNRIRPVESLIGTHPILTPQLLELARWISRYYAAPLETVLRSILPESVRAEDSGFKTRKVVVAVENSPDDAQLAALERRAPRQATALELVRGTPEGILLAEVERTAAGAARALEGKGWVRIEEREIGRDPHGSEEFLATTALELNRDQERALEAIVESLDAQPGSPPAPFLLHGVTGSGKTEVYLQAIEKVYAAGRNALVLVPEISLTPQAVERFKGRFAGRQEEVAVLHSHLGAGERHDEWHKIARGQARIVIGARSAVFAPLANLGIIVVDEEHENSYKQDTSPRYHGRDVAVLRGHLEGCPVILGSATPSLESFENVQRGKYRLLELPTRADHRKMPLIRVIDMRLQSRRGDHKGPSILSEKLRAAMEKRLEAGEQIILFLNRRGFATSLVCQECGFVCECAHCSVPLTFHRKDDRLLCHVCGFQRLAPSKCPGCKSPAIRFGGYGTEKVEEVLGKVFPGRRVARIDTDTMKRKNLLRDTLRAFQAKKIDILVGTQMIAKGLHFPNVTLVGILNADLGLHMPDFRAGERTFQLLTQVAGRAGRGDVLGEVIVQTFTPHSPSIQFARHHDFLGYADQELGFRRQFRYPPFHHVVLVTARSTHARRAQFTIETIAKRIAKSLPEGLLMGEPMPSPLEKASGKFRFQLMLRAASAGVITNLLQRVYANLTFPSDVTVITDVDAHSLM
ncbi:MAG: primosomal protein N' [Verrucomicrobiales bacterium]